MMSWNRSDVQKIPAAVAFLKPHTPQGLQNLVMQMKRKGVAQKKSQGKIAKKENKRAKKIRLKKSVIALAKASQNNAKPKAGETSSDPDPEENHEKFPAKESSEDENNIQNGIGNGEIDSDEPEENGSVVEDIDVDSGSDLESDSSEEELSKFSTFESSSSSSQSVAFRRVEPKVFQIKFHQDQQLIFQGKLVVTVLEGEVFVLGWRLLPGQTKCVFSNRGASAISLQGKSGALLELKRQDTNLDFCLRKMRTINLFNGLKEKTAGLQGPATTAKLLAERSLECRFLEKEGKNKVIVVDDPRWELPVQQLLYLAELTGFRAAICGGKGLGKSTFMRILINKILCQQNSDQSKVVLLDLDPGQSEFTAPGCLSVVEVSEPLLGPSFTHFKTPLRSLFLGQVDVSRCLKEYLVASEKLVEYCKSLGDSVPIIVNTMGFNTGVGVDIMKQVVKKLLECGCLNVVELKSCNSNRNYPEGTFGSECKVFELPSAAESFMQLADKTEWGMAGSVQREICIFSYLSPIVTPPHFNFLQELPHVIRLGYLVLGTVHEFVQPNHILRAVVGNLVALCKIEADHPGILRASNESPLTTPGVILKPPALPCFGYGVVSGIDLPAGQLYLQTPEAKENLREVNCLLMGSIQLPTELRTSGARGCVPFMSSGKLAVATTPVRVRYRPISSLVGGN